MTGVNRTSVFLAVVLMTGAGCATKTIPPNAGEPHTQVLQLEEVPRHVDDVMQTLQVELLNPMRIKRRAAPVSAAGEASDGSYTRWLTAVSEAIVYDRPLPQNIDRMSKRAYRDLARMAGRPRKDIATALDLSLLARRLRTFFDTQSAEVRKTAAAYLESAFSIAG